MRKTLLTLVQKQSSLSETHLRAIDRLFHRGLHPIVSLPGSMAQVGQDIGAAVLLRLSCPFKRLYLWAENDAALPVIARQDKKARKAPKHDDDVMHDLYRAPVAFHEHEWCATDSKIKADGFCLVFAPFMEPVDNDGKRQIIDRRLIGRIINVFWPRIVLNGALVFQLSGDTEAVHNFAAFGDSDREELAKEVCAASGQIVVRKIGLKSSDECAEQFDDKQEQPCP